MNRKSKAGGETSPHSLSDGDFLRGDQFFSLLNVEWWKVIDSFHEMITIQDVDCRILYANRAVLKTFSVPREKVIGEFCYRFFHHTHTSHCPFEANKEKQVVSEEYWEPSIEKWLSISTTPIFDSHGKPKGFVHVLRDITGQSLLQRAWQESEKKYETLFRNSADAILLHDFQGRILDVNPRAVEQFGYSKQEILSMSLEELHPAAFAGEMHKRLRQLEREEKTTFEIALKRKDGSTFPVEISAAIVNLDGERLVFGIVRDRTERELTNRFIRQRLTELETLYQVGSALNGLTDAKEIAQRVVDILAKKMYWHHAAIREYISSRNAFRLLAFNSPDAELGDRESVALRFQEMVPTASTGLSGYAVQQGKAIRVDDVRKHECYVNTFPGIRSGLYVPLKYGDKLVGVISIESEKLAAFSENDERFLSTVAEQLAASLETARLFSAEKRRATRLSKILALNTELSNFREEEKFLSHLAKRAREIARSDACLVLLLEEHEGAVVVAAQSGCSRNPVNRRVIMKDSPFQRLFRTGEALIIPDIDSEEPSLREKCPLPPSARGLFVYPMAIRGRLLGFLVFTSSKIRKPSIVKKTAMQLLANQSAASLQNLRLFDAMRHSMGELEAVNRISYTLRVVKTIDRLLSIFLDEVLEALNAENGVVWLQERDEISFVKPIARGWMNQVASTVHPSGQGIAKKVIEREDLYFIEDFSKDAAIPEEARAFVPEGFHGVGVPIRTETETIGAIVISVPKSRRLGILDTRLLSSIADIAGVSIQRIRLYKDLQQRLMELTALQIVEQAINASLDLRMTLDLLLDNFLSLVHVQAADILLFDEDSRCLELIASKGFQTGLPDTKFFHLGDRLPWRSVLEGNTVIIEDLQSQKEEFARKKWIEREGFVSYYAVPLVASGQFLGVLEVFFTEPLNLKQFPADLLNSFAAEAAIAIEKTRLFENLQRSNMKLSLAYDATVEGWGRAVELRDKETEGHTLRVTKITEDLARRIGVSEEDLVHIRRGALLHDIGKLGISDAILRKPGPLTDEEWKIMRRHPEIARDLLVGISYLKPALDIPYCHHEKWDGSGYPRGLKGEEIPLSARIFAVVDVYDALVSDRPYRKAWKKEKVLEYIREQSEKHFDPRVVETFLQMMAEREDE